MTCYRSAWIHLQKNWFFPLLPLILDIVSLGIGWRLAGFSGTPQFSIRAVLEMGLPSVSQVLNKPLPANTVEFFNVPVPLSEYAWIPVVVLILISAYMQGVYISGLLQIAEGKPIAWTALLKRGRKLWFRFLFLAVIIFFAKIAVTAFLVLFFQAIGQFASLLFFVALRIALFYLEFTIVADNVSVSLAFRQSFAYFKASIPATLSIAAVLFAVAGAISALIHGLWSPAAVIGGVFVYAYAMTWVQLAISSHYLHIKTITIEL